MPHRLGMNIDNRSMAEKLIAMNQVKRSPVDDVTPATARLQRLGAQADVNERKRTATASNAREGDLGKTFQA